MNLRGWISTIGLGVLMTGCAMSGTTPALQGSGPDARDVARALLGSQGVQTQGVTEEAAHDPEASRARLYQALGAARTEGTYQALRAVLAK